MPRVLIAGCGNLGSALGSLLARAGHEVHGLRRSAAEPTEGIRGWRGDLSRHDGLAQLPTALDTVFYTAAASSSNEDGYRRAYVDGPRNLLRALQRNGERLRRFLFVSSSAVYGQSSGEWVDEDSPTRPSSFRGRVLLEGEGLVSQAPYPSVVVRLAGIYGPGRTWLIDAVRAGRIPGTPQTPPLYTNRIHATDCAGLLAHLMEHPEPRALYLGVDDQPAPRAEVAVWLAERMGLELPVGTAPATARDGNKRCRNTRLRQSGYRLRFPTYREGYGDLLDPA